MAKKNTEIVCLKGDKKSKEKYEKGKQPMPSKKRQAPGRYGSVKFE